MKNIMLSAFMASLITNAVYADTLESLPKKDVLQLIEGNTLSTTALSTIDDQIIDNQFTGYFDKDGTMEGMFVKPLSQQPQKDVGTWMVKDDGSFCVTWDHWTHKERNCLAIYAVKNGYLFINQSTGNFENLTLNKDIKKGKTLKYEVK